MEWDGAVNAWHVAGDVFRMGRREWLTEAGWRQAYAGGIRTVIDLRNEAEIRRRETDPPVGAAALAGFDVVHGPHRRPGQQRIPRALRALPERPGVAMQTTPGCSRTCWPRVFKAVAAAEGGVVIHCSAGRDRSGMIAAMLQDLAGAQRRGHCAAATSAPCGASTSTTGASAVPHPHERYPARGRAGAPARIAGQEPAASLSVPENRGLPTPQWRDGPRSWRPFWAEDWGARVAQ